MGYDHYWMWEWMAVLLAMTVFINAFHGLKVLSVQVTALAMSVCWYTPSFEVSEEFSDLDERVVEEGWVLLADMSSDRRRDGKPAYTGIYSGLNPAVGPSPCATSGDSNAYSLFADLRLHTMYVDYHGCPFLFITILSFPFACYSGALALSCFIYHAPTSDGNPWVQCWIAMGSALVIHGTTSESTITDYHSVR